MIKKALIAAVLLVAGLCAAASFQPDRYTVTRSATIAAPAEKLFGMVNDFHNWNSWSPWAKLDPNMKQPFDGSPMGVGAGYAWAGNDEVGEGRMTITESQPAERIRIKLAFLKPWESTSDTTFTFKQEGDKTAVSWEMTGENNFMSKLFGLLMGGMDKMIGPDFEKGLAQMKAGAESK